jgi:hypothetical protein
MKRLLLICALLSAVGGCRKNAACRDHTIFLSLTLAGPAVDTDELQLSLTDAVGTLTADTAYASGQTLQVDFPPGRYPSGQSVSLTVIALANHVELARLERTLMVPSSCLPLMLVLGEAGDAAISDGALGDANTGGDAGGDAGGVSGDLAPGKLGEGAACTSGDQCASTVCVDGVCCHTACPGQCEACDVDGLAGQCVPVPSGPPHGARPGCDGADGGGACAGECSPASRTACTYPGPATTCSSQSCVGSTKYLPSGCDQTGGCSAQETRTCPTGCSGNDCLGACTGDGQCPSPSPYCDSGVCTVLKPRGRVCSAPSECTSGSCADGYCCNNDCTDQCRSCKESGTEGTCVKVTGAVRVGDVPARTACTGTSPCNASCDGVDLTCQFPGASTSCGTQSCSSATLTPVGSCNSGGGCNQPTQPCTSNVCNLAGTTCGLCPGDGTCTSSQYCDSNGYCQPKQGNGTGCNTDSQCTTGYCRGSVCCDSNCGSTTPACNANGSGCRCSGSSCSGLGSQWSCNAGTGACQCAPSCPACTTASVSDGCGNICPVCNTSCQGSVCCDSDCCGTMECGSCTTNCGVHQSCGGCTKSGSCTGTCSCVGGTCSGASCCGPA